MTDQTPPPPPPAPPPFTPPGPAAPQIYGQGAYVPAAPPPPRKKLKPGAIVAIVAGSVVLLGGIVVGLVAVTNVLTEAIRDSAPVADGGDDGDNPDSGVTEPLVTGDEASPIAVEPMKCGGCFTEDDLSSTIVDSDELDAFGLSTLDSFADYTAHYDSEATYYRNAWNDLEGDPDSCFVTFPQAPISILEPGPVVDDDSVISYTGVYADEDEWSSLGQSVRLFENDQDAVDYMGGLPALISACTRYTSGSGAEYWRADVTPAPALDLPPSVAGIGWVEQAEYDSRYYSFDLQRGNMVVRTSVFTGHEISEREFRTLIEHVAVQLAEISPD
jgi:hypothetical protein